MNFKYNFLTPKLVFTFAVWFYKLCLIETQSENIFMLNNGVLCTLLFLSKGVYGSPGESKALPFAFYALT
jgi:hypothetical protein